MWTALTYRKVKYSTAAMEKFPRCMEKFPAKTVGDTETNAPLVRHCDAWRRLLAVKSNGRGLDLLIEVGRIALGDARLVSICEIMGHSAAVNGGLKGSYEELFVQYEDLGHEEIESLRWESIAYRRPQPGKTYHRLPESGIVCSLPRNGGRRWLWCTKKVLYSLDGRRAVDEVFSPLYAAIHNFTAHSGRWRPPIVRQCIPQVRERIMAVCRSHKETGSCSDMIGQMESGRLCGHSGPHERQQSFDQHINVLSSHTTKLSEGALGSNKMHLETSLCHERKDEVSSQSLLLGLPTELLLEIFRHVIGVECLDIQLRVDEHSSRETPIFTPLTPLLQTSSRCRQLVKMICKTRHVHVLYGLCDENQTLERAGCQSVQYASQLSVQMDSFPALHNSLEPSFSTQIRKLIKSSPFLASVSLRLAPRGYMFPAILPMRLRRMFFTEWLQRIGGICNMSGVSFHYSVDWHAAGPDTPDDVVWLELTTLKWSSRVGCSSLVAEVIRQSGARYNRGQRVNAPTALWEAAGQGHVEIVKMLLSEDRGSMELKGHCLSVHGYGTTPLAIAAYKGEVGVVRLLWSRGAEVNTTDSIGRTPLMLAVYASRCEVVKFLCNLPEVDMNAADEEGKTALMKAVYDSEVPLLKYILRTGRVNANQRDIDGMTALSIASMYGLIAAIKSLCGLKEVDCDVPDDSGRTAISFAAKGGHMEAVKTLLHHGADPSIGKERELDARSLATFENHHKIVAFLDDWIESGSTCSSSSNGTGVKTIPYHRASADRTETLSKQLSS